MLRGRRSSFPTTPNWMSTGVIVSPHTLRFRHGHHRSVNLEKEGEKYNEIRTHACIDLASRSRLVVVTTILLLACFLALSFPPFFVVLVTPPSRTQVSVQVHTWGSFGFLSRRPDERRLREPASCLDPRTRRIKSKKKKEGKKKKQGRWVGMCNVHTCGGVPVATKNASIADSLFAVYFVLISQR